MYNKILGNSGERMACEILEMKGYVIMKKNYRCREGEIDVIAKKGSEIVFVEVKSRLDAGNIRPAEAINEKKKRRIRNAAERYIKEIERRGYYPSSIDFHVIEISAEHIRNAF